VAKGGRERGGGDHVVFMLPVPQGYGLTSSVPVTGTLFSGHNYVEAGKKEKGPEDVLVFSKGIYPIKGRNLSPQDRDFQNEK